MLLLCELTERREKILFRVAWAPARARVYSANEKRTRIEAPIANRALLSPFGPLRLRGEHTISNTD